MGSPNRPTCIFRTSKCDEIVLSASVNFPRGMPAAVSISVSPFDTQNSWREDEKADWAWRGEGECTVGG